MVHQPDSRLACAVEWRDHVPAVKQIRDQQVLLLDCFGLVLKAGAPDIQQSLLAFC